MFQFSYFPHYNNDNWAEDESEEFRFRLYVPIYVLVYINKPLTLFYRLKRTKRASDSILVPLLFLGLGSP
jgi:hypothetical protein